MCAVRVGDGSCVLLFGPPVAPQHLLAQQPTPTLLVFSSVRPCIGVHRSSHIKSIVLVLTSTATSHNDNNLSVRAADDAPAATLPRSQTSTKTPHQKPPTTPNPVHLSQGHAYTRTQAHYSQMPTHPRSSADSSAIAS